MYSTSAEEEGEEEEEEAAVELANRNRRKRGEMSSKGFRNVSTFKCKSSNTLFTSEKEEEGEEEDEAEGADFFVRLLLCFSSLGAVVWCGRGRD
jgi:hypothetical protein